MARQVNPSQLAAKRKRLAASQQRRERPWVPDTGPRQKRSRRPLTEDNNRKAREAQQEQKEQDQPAGSARGQGDKEGRES